MEMITSVIQSSLLHQHWRAIIVQRIQIDTSNKVVVVLSTKNIKRSWVLNITGTVLNATIDVLYIQQSNHVREEKRKSAGVQASPG